MTIDVLSLLCFSKPFKPLQRISVSLITRGTKGSSKSDTYTDTQTHTQTDRHTRVLEKNCKEKTPSYI